MNDYQCIGMSLNALRKSAGMTLKGLSDATGLSQGFLSKFERGQTTISLDSLIQIANALGTSIDQLLSQSRQQSGTRIIHRSYENSVLYMDNNYTINYQISNNYMGMDILPKLVVILPHQGPPDETECPHAGQEFVYVLEGILTLKVGSDIYELFPGDTAQYKSQLMHTWYNSTNRNTTILTVHTPNVFTAGASADPTQTPEDPAAT